MTSSFADAPGSPRSDRTRPSTRSVDLSRRSLLRASFALGGAGALAGLSGCGLAGQSSAPIDPKTSQTSQTDQSGGSGAQRVIGLYATDADNALVLGLPLVGSWSSDGRGFPAYQAARLQGVTPFSTDPQPDLDTITSLEPDLILGVDPDYYEADLLATLAKIAELDDGKTPDGDTSWQAVLRGVADRRGGVDAAKVFIADYEQRVSGLRDRVQQRWAGANFAYLGPMGAGQFYIAQPDMLTNEVLHDDLGLEFSSAVPASLEARRTDISFEELGMLDDTDILLVRTNPVAGGTEVDTAQLDQLRTAPLWDRVPAVAAGNVFLIEGDLFYNSPLTATANLDWVEQNLLA